MEFPDTLATRLTEKIMAAIRAKRPNLIDNVSEYNRTFEAAYETLEKELETEVANSFVKTMPRPKNYFQKPMRLGGR